MTGRPSPKLCFVIMPFKDDMKEVYRSAIKPACEKAGFTSLRVDELKGAFNINRKIIEHIFSSDAIVADLTGWNPNVFYEMGVAHAIDNKTITIIQKKDKLPFDVVTYRGIFYEQTEAGLVKLREDILESLQNIADWRQHPSNPVQDFKPRDALVLNSDFKQFQKALRQKEELLAAAQMETAALQKQLREKDLNLEQAAKKAVALQNELAQKQAETAVLQKEIQLLRQPPSPKAVASTKKPFRSQPFADLSVDAVSKMLKEKDFFDSNDNKQGKGVQHQNEKVQAEDQSLVIDHATGLTWQQSGSSNAVAYANAEKYVRDLNAKKFAGYNNWRLPTLEEAMSLMEAKEMEGLYIDPVFDRTQRYIWTADKADSAGVAWVAGFGYGRCYPHLVTNGDFVRVVR
jgi:nucleoside 2-deoxyribosyltransferase